MGIDIAAAQFLRSERDRGVSFASTLTLGRQHLYMSAREFRRILPECDYPSSDRDSKELFSHLGAQALDAIDASPYEGANIVHDMNTPLNVSRGQRWSCVFDGGSLEHIFNFPQAVKNCLEATAVGGHFLSITPWTGWAGHGFYQFCPELFYRILSEENGFQVERMLFHERNHWYQVLDPKLLGHRVELQSQEPRLLYISAKRIDERAVFASTPQQSDYASAWEKRQQHLAHSSVGSGWVSALASLCPGLVAHVRRKRAERKVMQKAFQEVSLGLRPEQSFTGNR
jgi:hypothetical protein